MVKSEKRFTCLSLDYKYNILGKEEKDGIWLSVCIKLVRVEFETMEESYFDPSRICENKDIMNR